MLNSLFSVWKKPTSTQSEYGGDSDNRRSDPATDRQSGHYRSTSWSSRARPGVGDTRSPFVASGGYFSGPAPIKAYSTAGSFRQRRDDPQDLQLQRYNLPPQQPQTSVQEKLIASLFQRQQRSSRRRTIREKYSSCAATEVDFHDIKERNEDTPFTRPAPPIQTPQSPRQQYYQPQQQQQQQNYQSPLPPQPRSHVYAQSEYCGRGNSGVYDSARLQRLSKQSAIKEESYDGLNDWGLPVAPQYYDEEDDEDEQINSDFSDDEEDLQPAKSVTYQRLVEEYTKLSHKGSASNFTRASSVVQNDTFSAPAKATVKPRTPSTSLRLQPKTVVTPSVADKFILLTYVLLIVCPIARQHSSVLLAALAQYPSYKSVLVQKVLVLAYLLTKSARPVKVSAVTKSKTTVGATTTSPVSSASTLVDRQKRWAADSKTRSVASPSVVSPSVQHNSARASSLRNAYLHKEEFSSWGF